MGIEQKGTRTTPRLDLGAAFMEFADQQKNLIGIQALPIFKTKKIEGVFSAITRESLTRDVDTKRAMRGKYNREGIGTEEKSYKCEEHGLEGALDDGERAMYASDFDAELVITNQTGSLVLLAQEKRIANALFDTAVFTGSSLYTDISSSAPFATVGSDVIGAIKTAREKVRQNCGMEPNALILSQTNINRLLLNTAVKAAIQYVARLTEAELLNALADILGVPKILIGKAIRNTANKGKTFSGSDVWSATYALLAVVAADGQDLTQPAIGRTFLWTDDSPENALVESYRDDTIKSDVFRVRQNVDEVVIDANFGHLLKVA